LRQSRSVRWAVLLGALYVVMDLLFTLDMGARGLLSPEGSIHLDAVALGVACLGVRVAGRVLLPVLLGFGLARAAVEVVVAWNIARSVPDTPRSVRDTPPMPGPREKVGPLGRHDT
jgi:Co/Zn/Cd efflux system component